MKCRAREPPKESLKPPSARLDSPQEPIKKLSQGTFPRPLEPGRALECLKKLKLIYHHSHEPEILENF